MRWRFPGCTALSRSRLDQAEPILQTGRFRISQVTPARQGSAVVTLVGSVPRTVETVDRQHVAKCAIP